MVHLVFSLMIGVSMVTLKGGQALCLCSYDPVPILISRGRLLRSVPLNVLPDLANLDHATIL